MYWSKNILKIDKTLGHIVYLLVIERLFFSWELPICFKNLEWKISAHGTVSLNVLIISTIFCVTWWANIHVFIFFKEG